jgi:hypothetical protein
MPETKEKQAAKKQVLFANNEVVVHILLDPNPDTINNQELYGVESKILLPGSYVELDKVPPYLRESVKKGEAPGLELMSESKAKKVAAQAEAIRNANQNTLDVGSISRLVKEEESVDE